ncbi:MAG TPA: polysaccharide deacetylase family protein [Thermoleophilia bacterium]|nr:polysaccharide deacetylase family protein [Thermoleophilia bacterium]
MARAARTSRPSPRGRRAPAALPVVAAALLALSAAACGGSHPATSATASHPSSPSSAHPSAGASAEASPASSSAQLKVETAGGDAILLRERKPVSFTFTFVGAAPATWVWRVRNFYGKQMVTGRGKPGATQATISWDGKDPGGRPADPGLYIVEAGPRFSTHMTTVARVRLQPPVKAKVYRSLPKAGKKVALTFDDGGGATAWYWILRELRAGHAKGTFFPIGEYVGDYARKEAGLTLTDDMAIGSHTWSHKDLTRLSDADIRAQLQQAEDAWWTGFKASTVPYLRPPYGAYDDHVLKVAGEMGYSRIIMWDVDSGDWTNPGTDVIVRRVLGNVHDGSIIVMHTRGKTPKALPRIIEGLHKMGYQMVTVPELFKAAGVR